MIQQINTMQMNSPHSQQDIPSYTPASGSLYYPSGVTDDTSGMASSYYDDTVKRQWKDFLMGKNPNPAY